MLTVVRGSRAAGGRGRAGLGTQLRREFFPEVDAGAFEIYVRAPTGTRIEVTEKRIAEVEDSSSRRSSSDDLRAGHQRDRRDARLVGRLHAQLGPDGRDGQGAARARNASNRPRSTSTCCARALPTTPEFAELEFAFDAGGMIRGAMNEGKSTPINIRITSKNLELAHQIAEKIQRKVLDDRRRRRLPHPAAARLPASTSSTSTAPRPPTWA